MIADAEREIVLSHPDKRALPQCWMFIAWLSFAPSMSFAQTPPTLAAPTTDNFGVQPVQRYPEPNLSDRIIDGYIEGTVVDPQGKQVEGAYVYSVGDEEGKRPFAAIFASGGSLKESRKVDFCDVVASPTEYFGQVLSVDVILWPGEHVLTLFGPACVPKEGYDITTQAILPANVDSLPNGKKLGRILKHQRPARVEVVGIFESREQQYGLDATRFRFSISQINSVSESAVRTGGK